MVLELALKYDARKLDEVLKTTLEKNSRTPPLPAMTMPPKLKIYRYEKPSSPRQAP
jgi:hypothetical protein